MNVQRRNAVLRRMARWVSRRILKRAEVEVTGGSGGHDYQPSEAPTSSQASTSDCAPTDAVVEPDPDAELYPEILFDAGFYAAEYPDVEGSRLTPWQHFTTRGRWEGHIPSLAHSRLKGAIALRSKVSATPLSDIVALFPHGAPITKKTFWERLRPTVHPDFYAAQLDTQTIPSIDETVDHFFGVGAFDGLRPSLFFNAVWYLRMLRARGLQAPGGSIHPFTHWLTVGWDHEIVPTPVFDDEFYRSRHPGVREFGKWTFPHYLRDGCYRTNRPGHPALTKLPPREHGERERQFPLLLHDVLASADAPTDLRATSSVERQAAKVEEALSLLESPVMQNLITKAAKIEPLIMDPGGPRTVDWYPHKHGRLGLMHQAEAVRTALPRAHYDAIVLIPDRTTALSCRVAGAFADGLRALAPDERLLLILTECPDDSQLHTFHDSVDVFDVSSYLHALHGDDTTRLLLDVLRGLTPKLIINVNSQLGWGVLSTFGKQLSTWSEIGAYLFSSRRDVHGNEEGYVIREFQECFDILEWVAVENRQLRDGLIDRYWMPEPLREKIRVLHPPAEPGPLDYSQVFSERRSQQWPLRAFWIGAGPQVRFDIVVEIAQQLPELEIVAWGGGEPNRYDLDIKELPANIRLKGEFGHLGEVPFDATDIVLFTSEWEGISTVLLDVGARGLAVVARGSGGVSDILDDTTGFVVRPPISADAYIRTIQTMVEAPMEVARRANALRERVMALCSGRNYMEMLHEVKQDRSPMAHHEPQEG